MDNSASSFADSKPAKISSRTDPSRWLKTTARRRWVARTTTIQILGSRFQADLFDSLLDTDGSKKPHAKKDAAAVEEGARCIWSCEKPPEFWETSQ